MLTVSSITESFLVFLNGDFCRIIIIAFLEKKTHLRRGFLILM